MSLVKVKKVEEEDEQIIKPEAVAPNLNTSDWPLLLKNWDQRKFLRMQCRDWHATDLRFASRGGAREY